jgi:hypothetical protein
VLLIDDDERRKRIIQRLDKKDNDDSKRIGQRGQPRKALVAVRTREMMRIELTPSLPFLSSAQKEQWELIRTRQRHDSDSQDVQSIRANKERRETRIVFLTSTYYS